MKMCHLFRGILAAVCLICGPLVVHAATGSWNIDADGNWSVNGNWTGATFPNAAADVATLGNKITADRIVTLTGNITLGQIIFNDDNKYTVTGAFRLRVNGNGSAVGLTQSGSGQVQIDSNYRINTAQTWDGAGTGTVTVNGVISDNGAGSDILTINNSGYTVVLNNNNTFTDGLTITAGTVQFGNAGGAGTGTMTLNGGTIQTGSNLTLTNAITVGGNFTVGGSNNITLSGAMALGGATRTITVDNSGATTFSGVVSGAGGGITKGGTGTLTLSGAGANTYSGTTTVNDGQLTLNKTAGTDAVAGALTIGDGTGAANSAIVQLSAANQINNGSAVSLNTDGKLDLNGNSDTIGTLAMTGGSITTGAGTLTLGGAVTGNAAATTATISGNLALGATRTFTIANGAAADDMDVSAVVSGGGFGITKAGAGTMVLSGASANTYSGTTTVNDGQLTLNKTAGVDAVAGALTIGDGAGAADSAVLLLNAANQINNASAVSLNTDGLFNLNGNNETIGTLAMTGGDITTGAGTLTLGGNVTGNAAATSAIITGNLALGASRTFTIANGAATNDMQIDATITGATFGIDKQGAGLLALNANNSFSGAMTVTAGTVEFGNNGANGTGTLTINGGAIQAGGGARTLDEASTVGGNFSVTGSNDLTLSGAMGLGAAARTVTVDNTGTTTFSGIVSGVGGSMIKAGNGTLVLSNNNTFNTGLTVNAGTVQFDNDGANGTGTLTLNGGAIQAGTGGHTLNEAVTVGGNFSVTGSNDLTLSGAMGIGAAARTITVDNTGNTTFSGIISGVGGSIVKAGNGVLILNNNNTFNTGLTINAGTVEFGNDGANGTGALTINGGTIRSGGGAHTLNEAVTIGGNFTVGGSNDLTLSGTIATGAAARTITIDNTGTTYSSGIISGTGGIIKEGTGLLRLNETAANTFTGGFTVNNGTVESNNNVINGAVIDANTLTIGDGVGAAGSAIWRNIVTGQVGNNSPVVINPDGVFDYNGSGIDTIGVLTMTEGSIIGGVGSDMRLTGNVTINATALGSVISVDVLQLIATTRTFTVNDGAAVNDLTMSGTIASSGVGNIIKAGAGNMLISGNNTYTGTTTINAGTVTVTSNNALGTNAAGTTVAAGATLAFDGGVTYSTTEALTINGTGVGTNGAIQNVSGNNSFAGAITMASASTIGSNTSGDTLTLSGAINNGGFLLTETGAGNVTLTGVVSGAGGLTMSGSGTLKLNGSANNTMSGATTINSGTLDLAAAGALNNTTGITVNSGGTLLFSGTSTTRVADTATLTLAGGTLTSNDATETMGALTMTAASVINLGTDAGNDDLTFASLTDSGGSVVIYNWTGKQYSSGTDDRIFLTGTAPGTIFGDVLFNGFNQGAIVLASHELVPIPEPGTIIGGVLLTGLVAFHFVRRRMSRQTT